MDFLFEIGYVTNLAVIVLTLGWLAVGVIIGFAIGEERADKRADQRVKRAEDFYRSYYSHPSNSR